MIFWPVYKKINYINETNFKQVYLSDLYKINKWYIASTYTCINPSPALFIKLICSSPIFKTVLYQFKGYQHKHLRLVSVEHRAWPQDYLTFFSEFCLKSQDFHWSVNILWQFLTNQITEIYLDFLYILN
jgi:hypothetical protein